MNPIRIAGSNRNFGAPADWSPQRDGECATLPVRDTGELLQSAWQPTAEELAALNAGASVVLTIWGRGHPVVSLGVEAAQPATESVASNVQVSEDGQIVTMFGVRYDIELFRHLGVGPIGSRVELVNRDDGVVTLKRLPAETECSLCAAGMNSFTDPNTGKKMHARNGTVVFCSAQKGTETSEKPFTVGMDLAKRETDSTVYRCKHGNYFHLLGGVGAPDCGCFSEKTSAAQPDAPT